ncbi:MAG: hypothetical protein V1772_09770 [Chloroflexota bacterium]
MAKEERREYRVELSEFERYLRDKIAELEACQKHAEALQARLDTIFKRELAAWQEVYGYCFPKVATGRRELPVPLVALIDRTEAEERARLRLEVSELKKKVADGRRRMDELSAEGQSAIGVLHKANPTVNKREEQLKALMVKYQDEYTQAYEKMDKLDDALFAWLTHAGELRKLKKIQREAKDNQAKTLAKLRTVRQEWLKKVEETGTVQSDLRTEWQKQSVETAEADSRREHLETNLEALAEQAAIRRVLENLDQSFGVPGELGEKLAELAKRNVVRTGYEQGLAGAAEAVGYLKGIGSGLTRFQSSVGSVLREQKQYNLAKVEVILPNSVAVINQTWKQFHDKVRDSEAVVARPVEFAALVKQYFSARLTDEVIKGFFETMGDALNKATKKWG